MKKLTILMTLLGLSLILSACTNTTEPVSQDINNDNTVLSYQALASVTFLETREPVVRETLIQPLSLSTFTPMNVEPMAPSIDQVEPYLKLVESLLFGDGFIAPVEEPSDNPDYETMIVFETQDLLGIEDSYTLYFTITESEFEEEDGEIEEEYTFEGILVRGETIYQVRGEKELEVDETSMEFTAYLDEENYLTSEYEFESEETEFTFTEVINGELYAETSLEIEKESDESKVEMEMFKAGNSYAYTFTYETEDGVPILKVEYDTEIDGFSESGSFEAYVLIDADTGETYYEIRVDDDEDGDSDHTYDTRDDDDDEDDDDEDDDDDIDT